MKKDQHKGKSIYNPYTLAFRNKDIEKEFIDDYTVESIPILRLSMVAGIIFYLTFGILDTITSPDCFKTLWFIRLMVVLHLVIVIVVTASKDLFRKFGQIITSSSVVSGGYGIISMISIIGNTTFGQNYYVGIILVFIWGFTFSRIRFAYAISQSLLLIILYEITAISINIPSKILISNNFFLVGTWIVGATNCYVLEYLFREDFRQKRLIYKKSDINNWENRVDVVFDSISDTLSKIIKEKDKAE